MNTPKKDYYAPMHTAEHILNRIMVQKFDCNRSENCHIERKKSKCDFILEKKPTDEQIIEIQNEVNNIILQNLEIVHNFIDFDIAAEKFQLRVDKNDNPKIRITSIGDFDHCPCIGEHVENTSKIGTFKISTTTYNDGVLRIRYKLLKPSGL